METKEIQKGHQKDDDQLQIDKTSQHDTDPHF